MKALCRLVTSLLFAGAVLALLSGCLNSRRGYQVEGEKVLYWYPSGPGNVSRSVPADAATFKVLPGGGEHHWAKDRTSVFLNGLLLHGVDAASFELLGGLYSRDRSFGYYYYGAKCSEDPAHFEVVLDAAGKPSGYARDRRHVYVGARILEGADPSTFVLLANGWKDKNGERSY